MGKQEQLPAEEQGPEKARNLSRWALLAAVGLGMIQDSVLPQKTEEEKARDMLLQKQQKPFELPPELAARFHEDKSRQLAGKRTLIHIGQMHSSSILTPEQRAAAAPYIIQNQKDIEKLILYFKDAYGIDTVFLEGMLLEQDPGVTPATEYMTWWNKSYERAIPSDDLKSIYDLFNAAVETFNLNVRQFPDNYRLQGLYGYFIKQKIRQFTKYLEGRGKGKEVPEYISARIEAIREAADALEVNQGDNIYVFVSSAELLWMEGKIKLAACDDRQSRKESDSIIAAHPSPFGPDAKSVAKKLYETNQIREDVVVKTATDYMANENSLYAVVIFGNAHDFSGNARKYNKTVTVGDTCGVISLGSTACDDYMKATNVIYEDLHDPKVE